MLNQFEIMETIKMIEEEHLDIRTITMGISLKDCVDHDIDVSCTRLYDKITRLAENLVKTGEDIENEYGIPIINKRISVTPIAHLADASRSDECEKFAIAMDKAAKEVGVNFIGGYSALVHKGYTRGEQNLIRSIPRALASTDMVCSSVNIGTTRAGINMDAVAQMGRIIKEAAQMTESTGGFACILCRLNSKRRWMRYFPRYTLNEFVFPINWCLRQMTNLCELAICSGN